MVETNGRRTYAEIDADALRAAAEILRAYGVPASANVCDVVADAIESGNRTRVNGKVRQNVEATGRIAEIKAYRRENPEAGLREAVQATNNPGEQS